MSSSLAVLLQADVRFLAITGTLGLLALFLSVTGFIAARNVLGDVAAVKALGIGPLPAIVAVLSQAYSISAAIGIPVAITLDWAAIYYLYADNGRDATYITFIHIVVTILLGTVVFGVLVLVNTRPA